MMTSAPPQQWDAFISHASEDKDSFVRPLSHALKALGANVWYDEFSLKLGDSLSASIDMGLAKSQFGIVVLSKAFIEKPWPKRELQGLVAGEIGGRSTTIPVWHGLTSQDVLEFSPSLADKFAVTTAGKTVDQIALQILSVIRPDIKIATGEAVAEQRATYATAFKVVYDILQSDTCRDARGFVFDELREKPFGEWTRDDRKQAERVCQSYDSVGIMCKNHFIPVDVVADSWGSSLWDLWNILSPLVREYRDKRKSEEFWDDFQWLANQAKAFHHR
jgi:TIR domain